MNTCPLVSIITPVYNGSEYLEDLILSVKNQDYPNIEHIIIDDGSRDNGATVSVLNRYPHLRWWTRFNVGQYATMNEGLLAAQGEIVCFVSADDIVSPGAVKIAVESLVKNDSLDAVYGATSHIDSEGNPYPYPTPFQWAPISFVIYFAHIPHCSFYIKKAPLLVRELLFASSFQSAGDYEWMIRISQSNLRVGMIKQELSRIRIHANQATQKHLNRSLAEQDIVLKTYRVNKILYQFLSSTYFLNLRTWKLSYALKSRGIRGVFDLVEKWYKISFR